MADYEDGQDNPGIKVPPPLIYLLPLVLYQSTSLVAQ
jgi:hypothetical protein